MCMVTGSMRSVALLKRVWSRATREIIVDLSVMSLMVLELAVHAVGRGPESRRAREQIRGYLSMALANARRLATADAPPIADTYGLPGWNYAHRDFWIRPAERPAAFLWDSGVVAPVRNGTLRMSRRDGVFVLAGGHFCAPTRLLPATAYTLPASRVPRSTRWLRRVPASVVQRILKVDLEPFHLQVATATWLPFAPGWETGDSFSPFEARSSVSFHSFRLIFGREIIDRRVLEGWTRSLTHFITKLKR